MDGIRPMFNKTIINENVKFIGKFVFKIYGTKKADHVSGVHCKFLDTEHYIDSKSP